MRWLHIYLSMFGLAAVLFFSATGVTLNHPDWFFGETERSTRSEGDIDRQWLHLEDPRSRHVSPRTPISPARSTSWRWSSRCGRPTASAAPLPNSRSTNPNARSPSRGRDTPADAFIERDTGHYTLTQSFHGVIAVLNDLHKGRDTGLAWSILIDASAIVLTVISLSGLVLLFYLKLRRIPGLVVAVIGAIVVLVLFLLGVP